MPFALLGLLGLVTFWLALRRLFSTRIANLAIALLATSPFYLLASRQAITDMPMLATALVALSCLWCGLQDQASVSRRLARGVTLFWSGLTIFQLAYDAVYLESHATGVGVPRLSHPAIALLPVVAVMSAVCVSLWRRPIVRQERALLHLAGAFTGLSVLAKGPAGLAVIGLGGIAYCLASGRLRRLPWRALVEALAIALCVAAPWHLAAWLVDGVPWVAEYFGHNWFKRASFGVHGDRGTGAYYLVELLSGTWPWGCAAPAAIAVVLRSRRDAAWAQRATILLWGCLLFGFFAAVETKFHHYILPVVPALAVLVALALERYRIGVLVASLPLLALASFTLAEHHDVVIELITYRHDRPWPSEPPWQIDLSGWFWALGIAFFVALAIPARRARSYAVVVATGLVGVFVAHLYMKAAAPHWGQRDLIQRYYRERTVYGLRLLEPLRGQTTFAVDMAPTRAFAPGDQLNIERVDGTRDVARAIAIDGARVTLTLGDASASLDEVPTVRARPDADRLIAWRLYWRGENFWSGDEIWGERPADQTAFGLGRENALRDYLQEHGIAGRRYFVVTEAASRGALRGHLPTERARKSLQVLDDLTCNKFVLLVFTL
jgi:4-amino-4-deoxy-L-arabinose transferase-like glycosyltransferase